jgi:hypothetical protein
MLDFWQTGILPKECWEFGTILRQIEGESRRGNELHTGYPVSTDQALHKRHEEGALCADRDGFCAVEKANILCNGNYGIFLLVSLIDSINQIQR